MTKHWLSGVALAAALAFSGAANAQIKMGVAGPITGPNAAFGAQLVHGTTQAVEDINDIEAVDRAIVAAKADPRPSFIRFRSHIGYGAPNKQDTKDAHGEPLGEAEVKRLTAAAQARPGTKPTVRAWQDGKASGVGVLRRFPRGAHSRLCSGVARKFLQLVLTARVAEHHFVSGSREDRSELGAHQSRTENTQSHGVLLSVTPLRAY